MTGPGSPRPTASSGARIAAFVAWSIFCCVIWVFSKASRKMQPVFEQLEMTDLPIPTELILGFSAFVAGPAGLAVGVLAWIGGSALAFSRYTDRHPLPAVLAPLVGSVLYAAVSILSVHLPIWKIRQALEA